MAKRADPHRLAAVAAVQRVRVLAAEAALGAAREAQDTAREAQRCAAAIADASATAWADHVAGARFAPEFARALAADVLRRDADHAMATERTTLAEQMLDRRRIDWQVAEARADATDEAHAAARRAARRRRDERSLADAADRISLRWRRP